MTRTTANGTIVVRGMSPPPDAALDRVQTADGEHVVAVAADPPLSPATLIRSVRAVLPAGCRLVRLVLSYGTRDDLAQVLADRLRVTVYAPSGAVLLLPSGALFVVDGEWQSFGPGRRPVGRHGSRHPAPRWQTGLGVPAAPAGLMFRPIPAGLWLHAVEHASAGLPAAVLTIPGNPERLGVLIGHPEAPPLPESAARDALLSLPDEVRQRLALIPYGPDSVMSHRLAERVAERAGADVEVVSGVPDADERGQMVFTTIGADGRRGWRPYGQWFVYPGSTVPSLRRGRPLIADVPMQGATQHLGYGWVIETVRSGWFARREDGDAEADMARRVPALAAHPIVVLGAAAAQAPDTAEWLVDRIVAEMPPELGASVRLVLTRPPADIASAPWRQLNQRYGDFLRLGNDGALLVVSRPEPSMRGDGAGASTVALRTPLYWDAMKGDTVALRPPAQSQAEEGATVALRPPAQSDAAEGATVALRLPSAAIIPLPLKTTKFDRTGLGPYRLSEVDALSTADSRPAWSFRRFRSEAANLDAAARSAAAVLARMTDLSPADREQAALELTALSAIVGGGSPEAMGELVDLAAAGLARLPARAGAFPAPWERPDDSDWQLGRVYASTGILGAGYPGPGVAAGDRLVAVWSMSARPLPVQLGATPSVRMVPPRTHFVVSAVTDDAVLLHEVIDDATPELVASIRTSLRRTADAWFRSLGGQAA